MVAYSFQRRFADPIRAGSKRQTIRATGKRRHARPGEPLQLYVGMRTSHCQLIQVCICQRASEIEIIFGAKSSLVAFERKRIIYPESLDEFARRDGFTNWADLREFWRVHHPGVRTFRGVMIEW